jgi:outer membrane protein assembly factor BamB
MKRLATTLLLIALTAVTSSHANWPRLRGAEGNGIAAKDADVPLTWSDTENLSWKAAMPGPGSSSPVVWGEKVFVTCWSGYGGASGGADMTKLVRHLVCLNLSDGRILWDKTVPAVQPEDVYQGMLTEHGYASNTPVTDGEHVFVFFGKSGALAFDMDGNQLWQTDLGKSSSSKQWGSAASPIVYKDFVIVNASDESRAIYALDKKSGSQIWKADADALESAYSTPSIVTREGGVQDLVLAVAQELWGLNPDTGKLRWYAQHNLPGNVSTVVGSDALYVFGGFPVAGSVAFKIGGGKGDVTADTKLWAVTDSSYVPTPVLHEGRLHVINDGGFAMCLDAKTGASLYRERVMESSGDGGPGGGRGKGGPGGGRRGGGKPFYASPVLVGDKLYCVSRKNGTFVLSAGPEYKKLAVNVIASDTSQFNGTPAVVGKRLIMRSDSAVYCVSAK